MAWASWISSTREVRVECYGERGDAGTGVSLSLPLRPARSFPRSVTWQPLQVGNLLSPLEALDSENSEISYNSVLPWHMGPKQGQTAELPKTSSLHWSLGLPGTLGGCCFGNNYGDFSEN